MTCIIKKVLPALARTLSIENSKTQEQDVRQKKNIPSKWLKLYKRFEVDWDELLDLPAIYNPLLGICNNC